MQTYREQTETYKLKWTGIVKPKKTGSKNKRPRLWKLESRWPNAPACFGGWKEWRSDYRTYRTEEEAKTAAAKLTRKHRGFEYRVVSKEKA